MTRDSKTWTTPLKAFPWSCVSLGKFPSQISSYHTKLFHHIFTISILRIRYTVCGKQDTATYVGLWNCTHLTRKFPLLTVKHISWFPDCLISFNFVYEKYWLPPWPWHWKLVIFWFSRESGLLWSRQVALEFNFTRIETHFLPKLSPDPACIKAYGFNRPFFD